MSDEQRLVILEALATGKSIPSRSLPRAFQKVAHILEEAVGGFEIDAHTNFWTGITTEIRPLFRDFDYLTLKRFDSVDLNNLNSVRANAKILRQRLEAGTLPYDACWSSKQIALFGRWVDGGMRN